jgi:DNA primase
MPMYAREDLDRIRDATDFVALVEGRVELERAGGGNFKCLCPFHDERSPSMSIKADDKLFHCFGCQEGGDLFRWVELTEGVDFTGAVELLADRAGIQLKTEEEDPETAARRKRERRLLELLDRTNRFYERQLWDSAEGAQARAELQRRGLDPDLLREFRVGYAPSAWDRVLVGSRHAGYTEDEMVAAGVVMRARDNPGRLYDRFRRRITFPLADRRGRIMGFGARAIGPDQKPKYVNSSDGPVYHKGRHLFAAHVARKQAARTGEVILCEGYTDVIALHQSGLTNAVGLMGTALTPEQIGALGKLAPSVVLALDADRAGREAMLRAAQLAAGSGLKMRVVLLPDGMDPADLLAKRGPEAVKNAFAEPMALGRFHVGHVLAQSDLSDAEGKDKAIEDLRPVFAGLPPGVLRMELLNEAANKLRLDPTVLGSLIDHPPAAPVPVGRGGGSRGGGSGQGRGGAGAGRGGQASGGQGGRGGQAAGGQGARGGQGYDGGAGGARQGGSGAGGSSSGGGAGSGGSYGGGGSSYGGGSTGGGRDRRGFGSPRPQGPVARTVPSAGGLEDVARVELAFLAECFAAGPEAADLLDDTRIRTQMINDAHRTAAIALREALRSGQPPAASDDSARMVLDLIRRMAAGVQHPSCAAAELAGLRLELGVVTEALRSGRGFEPGASPQALVLRRLELQRRIDQGLGELLKGPRRTA